MYPRRKTVIQFCWNREAPVTHDRLMELLGIFGDLFPTPLHRRLALESYAAKLLERADIGCAVHGNRIIGFAAVYVNDTETKVAYLSMLAVLPEYQNQGIGKMMMSRIIALAREEGMRTLWLDVERSNYGAQRFYQSLGFRKSFHASPKRRMEMDLTAQFGMLEPQTTLVEQGSRLAAAFGLDIDLRIKRDDLYPVAGGGIKARKAGYIIKDGIQSGHDALVTNGGAQSNHARSIAVLAATLGLRCHLVIVLDPCRRHAITGNLLLMKMSGATIEFCAKDELASRMERAMGFVAKQGHRPLYIWGGGHSLQGTVAFVEAAAEAQRQCGEWVPDYLILASGTGTTQAGLAIGYANLPTNVTGISVARGEERGTEVIRRSIDEYEAAINRYSQVTKVSFRDEWTDGGYESYSPELFAMIDKAATCGFFFDPTYSGKALRGLVAMVREGEIPAGSRVLLWHTGGLMNLQAAQHYAGETFELQD